MRNDERGHRKRGGIVVGVHLGLGKGRTSPPQWGILWGGLIAVIGLAILVDNLGLFPGIQLVRFWPMILVAIGLMNIACRSGRFFGVILVIVGAMLQLSELGYAHFGWNQIWPVALISVGLLVMWSSLEARKRLSNNPPAVDDPVAQSSGDARGLLNEVAIFGGVDRRVVTNDFRGGAINAIFGGVELDLSHAEMIQPQAELEVNAIFGGVELRVPDEWRVVSRNQAIFGGYDDKTRASDLPDNPDAPRKTLLLTGSVIFGGVEIKS
jgi:predicted membrane protein